MSYSVSHAHGETVVPDISGARVYFESVASAEYGDVAVHIGGTYAVAYHRSSRCGGDRCGGHHVGMVRVIEPWYSMATDSWVAFDSSGAVVPVSK